MACTTGFADYCCELFASVGPCERKRMFGGFGISTGGMSIAWVLDLGGGTAFQQAVWKSLLDIAPGTTSSYGTISQRIDKPSAARAVGAAIGRNPISIIVPCHRVVGAHGAMTGYAGGIDRKIALLQLESSI